MPTNFEKLIGTLEGAGAKVSQMKKNFGDIYTIENGGKQIIVKMFKENESANTLYTKVYIDGHAVYSSSISPANEGKNVEAISKDLLDFINKIFKVAIKDVEEKENPAPAEQKETPTKEVKETGVNVDIVLAATQALVKAVESLEVVKDVLVKLVK